MILIYYIIIVNVRNYLQKIIHLHEEYWITECRLIEWLSCSFLIHSIGSRFIVDYRHDNSCKSKTAFEL